MTQLHWALLMLAAVLLIALYLYGKWQERKSKRGLHDSTGDADAPSDLLPNARAPLARHARQAPVRIEPTMGNPSADSSASDASDVNDSIGAEPVSPVLAPASVGGWTEDALLDVMLELRCAHSFDGVAALEARAQLDRLALLLPTHLAVWDQKAAQWTLPDRFGFYSEMLIAVQLATRRHRLGEIDATRFVSTVQQIAVSIDADFDPPDVARIVQQAASLDRLCAQFDVQITLTLEAQAGPWTREAVDAAADDAQMLQVEPMRWELSDAHDRTLLSMISESAPISRLAITLDVPLAPTEHLPLSVLFATARQMADRLNARVVDDNGRPVETAAQSVFETELHALTAAMQAAGIEPGSLRARRLYS